MKYCTLNLWILIPYRAATVNFWQATVVFTFYFKNSRQYCGSCLLWRPCQKVLFASIPKFYTVFLGKVNFCNCLRLFNILSLLEVQVLIIQIFDNFDVMITIKFVDSNGGYISISVQYTNISMKFLFFKKYQRY